MTLQDLVVTPIWLLILYALAYAIRPSVTTRDTRKYFIPALTVKFVGAIGVGLVYYFYYKGGDTINYFDHGSKWIWEAFNDSPIKGLKLIFANGIHYADTFEYSSKIWFYTDLPSYFVVRAAAALDILTFHTYSATAILFAYISFFGLWFMYKSFVDLYPKLSLEFAISIFFIPSVFFWGSGILKDSITLGALGWAVYATHHVFIKKRRLVLSLFILVIALYTIYSIKVYIVLCFVPTLILWIGQRTVKRIRNQLIKYAVLPIVLVIIGFSSTLIIRTIGQENSRYSIDSISKTAEVTARWINYVSDLEGGSSYTLGDFDYSTTGVIRKIPSAIGTTLYRPFLWESSNPLMLISSLEALVVLILTLQLLFRVRNFKVILRMNSYPDVLFLVVFSLMFAFAVGITTYNFGSLVRYKIPLLPFLLSGFFIIKHVSKQKRSKWLTKELKY